MGKRRKIEMFEPDALKEKKAEKGQARDLEVERDEEEVRGETGRVLKQQEILQQLQAAKEAEAKVRVFAKIMDTYGVDFVLSLIPKLGDEGASALSGIYLLYEARKAGLKKTDYIKIIGLQAADIFIGAIPIAGDVADYFFKANKRSIPMFRERTAELAEEARHAGVSEESIAKITQPAEKLPRLVENAVKLHKIHKMAA